MQMRRIGCHALLWLLLLTPAAIAAETGDARQAAGLGADTRIERHVASRLAWDAELAPYALDVEVNEGMVRLSGAVATATESHQAFRIADAIEGVAGVINTIRVDPALEPYVGEQGEPPNDAELKRRIEAVLEHTDDLNADAIEVAVDNGHVRLSGQVVGASDQVIAGRLVRSLYGVHSVVNDTGR